jgi:hypothetical protein
MKYIKKFNESKKVNYDDVKKFCEDHLAYLIDIGYELGWNDSQISEDVKIIDIVFMHGFSTPRNIAFRWTEISDDFIPFLQILNKKFELLNIIIHPNYTHKTKYNIEYLTSGKIREKKIAYITLSIKK